MGEFDVIPKLVGRVTFADRVLPEFTTAQVKKAVLPHKDRERSTCCLTLSRERPRTKGQQTSGEQPAGEVSLAANDYVIMSLAPAPPTSNPTTTIPNPTITVSLSSRGRVRKQKTFGDQFVRLDDDGAPDK